MQVNQARHNPLALRINHKWFTSRITDVCHRETINRLDDISSNQNIPDTLHPIHRIDDGPTTDQQIGRRKRTG
jgi:hypothetical protein